MNFFFGTVPPDSSFKVSSVVAYRHSLVFVQDERFMEEMFPFEMIDE